MKMVFSCCRWLAAVCVGSLALGAGAAVTKRVTTAAVGEVEVVCADAKGWTFDLSSTGDADRTVVTVKMHAPAASMPPVFNLYFHASGAGVQNVWTSNYDTDGCHLWPWAWWGGHTTYASQLAGETPIAVAFDGNDRSKLAVACSEAFNRVRFGLYALERTCVIEGRFEFFTQTVNPVSDYEVSVLIDRRDLFWADAVRNATDWISATSGFRSAAVPEAAFDPLYSTWYAYWQDVHDGELEKEAALAAALGMKTMILDDGWQKVESASFYSATGDWMPVKSRFPDMKEHVRKVHACGLKYMLWLSVPYVGDESRSWARFKDKLLYCHGSVSPGRIGVLDPRFPDVRDYLIRTYERVVGEWGFDGVKLDFIDQFVLNGADPAAADGYRGRDIRSLPEAVDVLMKEVLARLKRINPDVLVEFRQHYMGPAIRQYGNMIRAADCPADPLANRRRIADLRLTSGTTAVHSDMLVWSKDETPAGAALPILNALFSVIQYSMVLNTLPPSHREVIRHWLRFSVEHRDALLKGSFRPHHPELGYTWIEAASSDESVAAVYSPGQTLAVDGTKARAYVINATRTDVMVLDLPRPAMAETFDTVGASQGTSSLAAGLQKVKVPASGYLRLTF